MDAATHHDPASLWAPRRQLTLAQARKRSERVRMLRMLFVACAAVSIGFFAGHVIKSALTSDSRPVSVTKDASVTMLNPRFTGRDSTGQSFQITADAAPAPSLAGSMSLQGNSNGMTMEIRSHDHSNLISDVPDVSTNEHDVLDFSSWMTMEIKLPTPPRRRRTRGFRNAIIAGFLAQLRVAIFQPNSRRNKAQFST